MKKIETILAILPALLFFCIGDDTEKHILPTPITPLEPGEKVVYYKRAKEQSNLTNQCYRINSGATEGLYNENYPKKDGDNSASFLRPYDGLASGTATLHALGYDVNYTDMVSRFDVYYRTSSGGVNAGGYGSSTNDTTGGGTRYYDDSSTASIDLVETYSLANNQTYLTRVEQIVGFLKSGEDNIFEGGLWWDEDEKSTSRNENSNKPSCANRYAVLFLLDYYSVCPQSGKAKVFAFTKRLHDWIVANLHDPIDGCYWSDKRVSDSIREVKWTYNTGAMISDGVWLYKITGEQTYLDSAVASSDGAHNYFIRPLNRLALAYPDYDSWFTTKLVCAFVGIEPCYKNAGNYIKASINFLDYAYENARLPSGLFYEDWTGANPRRAEQLLMQDAVSESLGIIALYRGETVTEKWCMNGKIRNIVLSVSAVSMLFSCAGEPKTTPNKDKAEEMFRHIWELYWVPKYDLFSEYYSGSHRPDLTYFNGSTRQA